MKRTKGGRPKGGGQAGGRVVSIRFPPPLLKQLDGIADERSETRSEAARALVELGIEATKARVAAAE